MHKPTINETDGLTDIHSLNSTSRHSSSHPPQPSRCPRRRLTRPRALPPPLPRLTRWASRHPPAAPAASARPRPPRPPHCRPISAGRARAQRGQQRLGWARPRRCRRCSSTFLCVYYLCRADMPHKYLLCRGGRHRHKYTYVCMRHSSHQPLLFHPPNRAGPSASPPPPRQQPQPSRTPPSAGAVAAPRTPRRSTDSVPPPTTMTTWPASCFPQGTPRRLWGPRWEEGEGLLSQAWRRASWTFRSSSRRSVRKRSVVDPTDRPNDRTVCMAISYIHHICMYI